jgi:peptide/nickel transport system substrate-binding protein
MMTTSRRRFIAGLTAGAAWPAARAGAQSPPQPQHGGILNYVIDPEPSTLNCFNTSGGPAIQASTKVLEGLLTYDFDLNAQPRLATAWSVGADGIEYRFDLRRNVKWLTARRSPPPTSSIRSGCSALSIPADAPVLPM